MLAAFAATLAAAAPLTADLADPAPTPVGFAGDAVLVQEPTRVLLAGPAGLRVLARDDRLAFAAGSADALALVTTTMRPTFESDLVAGAEEAEPVIVSPARGVSEVRAGPPGGPFGRVLRCTGREAYDPIRVGPAPVVVAGPVVAVPDCARRRLVILDGARRADADAGGRLLAVAAAGRRVAWISVRSPREADVHVLDLDTGGRRVVAGLGPVGEPEPVQLALADDGRLRAAVVEPRDPTTTLGDEPCRETELRLGVPGSSPGGAATPGASASAPRTTRRDPCPFAVALTAEGSAELRYAGRVSSLVRRAADGRVLGEPVRVRLPGAFGFHAQGDRLALAVPTCTGTRLVAGALAEISATAAARCPVRLVARTVRADARGRVAVPVACPRGCLVHAGGGVLFSDAYGGVSLRDVRVRPGGTGVLRFALDAETRRVLARRGTLRMRVAATALGGSGLEPSRIRVVRARR